MRERNGSLGSVELGMGRGRNVAASNFKQVSVSFVSNITINLKRTCCKLSWVLIHETSLAEKFSDYSNHIWLAWIQSFALDLGLFRRSSRVLDGEVENNGLLYCLQCQRTAENT